MFDFGALLQGLLDTLLGFIQEFLVELVTNAISGGTGLF